MTPSRIEKACIDKGLKMTGQRRVIARVLSDATDHPDVEELYRRSLEIDAKISIATVYRTVRLLEDRGIVERRDFGGGRSRYDPTDRGLHHHLIDVETGKVIEFENAALLEAIRAIATSHGFALVGQRLELYGRRVPQAAEGKPASRRGRAEHGGPAAPRAQAVRGRIA